MDILIDLTSRAESTTLAIAPRKRDLPPRNAEWQTQELKRKDESLTITCQALWELLSERLDLREDLILQKMQEIDLRDGKMDGKISSTLTSCPSCARTNKADRKQCLYCGSVLPTGHIFSKT